MKNFSVKGYKKRYCKGISILEVFIIVVILGIGLVLASYKCSTSIALSRIVACKSNLGILGQSIYVYKNEYGRHIFFPDTNGSPFLVRLYKLGILYDPNTYLCPATDDYNNAGKSLFQVTEGDPDNVCSYAGRKNRIPKKYPGIFSRYLLGPTLSPIACDDMEQKEGENHIPVLFLNFDSSVFEDKIKDSLDYLRDPLTN